MSNSRFQFEHDEDSKSVNVIIEDAETVGTEFLQSFGKNIRYTPHCKPQSNES